MATVQSCCVCYDYTSLTSQHVTPDTLFLPSSLLLHVLPLFIECLMYYYLSPRSFLMTHCAVHSDVMFLLPFAHLILPSLSLIVLHPLFLLFPTLSPHVPLSFSPPCSFLLASSHKTYCNLMDTWLYTHGRYI